MIRTMLASMAFVGCDLLPTPAARANFVLSGASVFDTNSSGAAATTNIWDTTAGNGFYNLYFTTPNTGLGGSFINSGDGPSLAPNYSMSAGSYQFYVFASPGAPQPYFGINLCLNGTSAPSISAYAPEGASPTASHPAPMADGNTTRGLDGSFIPGAGTLTFVSGAERATLTDFLWSAPSATGGDRVGSFGVGADGTNDFVGTFMLTVSTAVPEPSSLALISLAGLIGAGYAGLRRKTA